MESLIGGQTQTPSLRQIADSLEEIIVVCHYGRSGSVFLQSLLDGHPHTLSTPGVSMGDFYSFYKQNAALPKEQLIRAFVDEYRMIFDATCVINQAKDGVAAGFTNMGPAKNEILTADSVAFVDYMSNILSDCSTAVPRKLFFQALHVAYKLAQGQGTSIAEGTRIVFPLHAGLGSQIAEDFPKSKYVLTVREPIQNLASNLNRFKDDACRYAVALHLILFDGEPHQPNLAYAYRAVKLEDIHAMPRETMERLCAWLALPWCETLLKSTFNGKDWWGDTYSLNVNGFSNKIVSRERHSNLVPEFDKFRLNSLLECKRSVWKYDANGLKCTFRTKVFLLPLLMVPFALEIPYYIALRREKLSFLNQNSHSQATWFKFGKKIYWFSGIGTCKAFLEIRGYFWKAWINAVLPKSLEVRLL